MSEIRHFRQDVVNLGKSIETNNLASAEVSHYVVENLLKDILEDIKPKYILDIGCYYGYFPTYLYKGYPKLLKESYYVGIDIGDFKSEPLYKSHFKEIKKDELIEFNQTAGIFSETFFENLDRHQKIWQGKKCPNAILVYGNPRGDLEKNCGATHNIEKHFDAQFDLSLFRWMLRYLRKSNAYDETITQIAKRTNNFFIVDYYPPKYFGKLVVLKELLEKGSEMGVEKVEVDDEGYFFYLLAKKK